MGVSVNHPSPYQVAHELALAFLNHVPFEGGETPDSFARLYQNTQKIIFDVLVKGSDDATELQV